MTCSDFEAFADHALDNIFAFADFTKQTEHLFDDSSNVTALHAFQVAWFELEIVNATALSEWETDGRPENWDAKWNGRFLSDAVETVGMVKVAAQRLLE